MKISIIGNGSWGGRLYNIYSRHYQVDIWSGRSKPEKLNDTVIIAVPGKYFIDTVDRWSDKLASVQAIYSACKGITATGQTPLEYLNQCSIFRRFSNSKLLHLGGPNIAGSKGIIEIGKTKKERQSIFKNIYSIGYGIILYRHGVNYAADFLGKCIEELGVADRDLIAGCVKLSSRNAEFGYLLAKGETTIEAGQKTSLEGLFSAKMVILWDLYRDYKIIREISLSLENKI